MSKTQSRFAASDGEAGWFYECRVVHGAHFPMSHIYFNLENISNISSYFPQILSLKQNFVFKIEAYTGRVMSTQPFEIPMNNDYDNNTFAAKLAYAALDETPTPKENAKEIVGLVKSGGKVTGYQLSDGTAVSKEAGVSMAKSGDIRGVGVAHRKDSEYLKSLPDGTENNNLSNLPSVTEEEVNLK